MRIFSLEQSRLGYQADFVLYAAANAGLLLWLVRAQGQAPLPIWPMLALAAAGVALWTLLEYGLHRIVLHRFAPFSRWHGLHHARATALIGAPTSLSASLFLVLVAVPASMVLGTRPAAALMLGVLTGYLAYIVTHHALHHWRGAPGGWLERRKLMHSQHHLPSGRRTHFGVTSAFWDRVFGTCAPMHPAQPLLSR